MHVSLCPNRFQMEPPVANQCDTSQYSTLPATKATYPT